MKSPRNPLTCRSPRRAGICQDTVFVPHTCGPAQFSRRLSGTSSLSVVGRPTPCSMAGTPATPRAAGVPALHPLRDRALTAGPLPPRRQTGVRRSAGEPCPQCQRQRRCVLKHLIDSLHTRLLPRTELRVGCGGPVRSTGRLAVGTGSSAGSLRRIGYRHASNLTCIEEGSQPLCDRPARAVRLAAEGRSRHRSGTWPLAGHTPTTQEQPFLTDPASRFYCPANTLVNVDMASATCDSPVPCCRWCRSVPRAAAPASPGRLPLCRVASPARSSSQIVIDVVLAPRRVMSSRR